MEKKVNGEILTASDYFEGVLDAVDLLLQENSGIDLIYDDANDILNIGIDYSITPTWTGEHTFDAGISLLDNDKLLIGDSDDYSIRFDPDDGPNGAVIFEDENNTDVEMKFKIGGGIEYAFQTIETKLAEGEDIYKFVNGASGDDVRSGFDSSGFFVKSAFDSSASTTRDIYQIEPGTGTLNILETLNFPNITGTPTFANHDHSETGMAQVDHSSLSGIGAEDHHSQIQVSDSGSAVLTQPSDMNFGANITVTDDGDGSLTIDASGSTDTRVNVSDDGTQVVAEPTDINFGTNVSVTDDGDGTVTVEASSGGTDVAVYDDGTSITSATEIIDFQQDFSVTSPASGEAEITLDSNTITVAGNSVSLGGSTGIASQDLSNVTVTGIEYGLALNKPSPGTEGRVWIETDSQKIEYDTGSAWVEVGLSEGEISLANLESNAHADLSSINSDDHHIRPSAGTLLTEDASNNFNVDEASIDHDNLTNFVANEHIDHSTVSITAGTHLTGGGDLTSSRTLNVDETTIAAENLDGSSGAQGQFLQTDGTSISWADVEVEEVHTATEDYTTQGESTILVDAATDNSYTLSELTQDQSLDISSDLSTGANAEAYAFSEDGKTMIIAEEDSGSSTWLIHQWTLSTAGDLDTASYVGSISYEDIITDDPIVVGLEMGDGGSKIYMMEYRGELAQWNLSTPDDITTAGYVSTSAVDVQVQKVAGFDIAPDGTKCWTLSHDEGGGAGTYISEYTLSTAWDSSTQTNTADTEITSGFTSGDDSGIVCGLTWNGDGSAVQITWDGASDIDEYTVGTAYDISDSFSFNTSTTIAMDSGLDWATGKTLFRINPDTTVERFYTGDTVNQATITLSSSDNTSGNIVRVKEASNANSVDITVTAENSSIDGGSVSIESPEEAITAQSDGSEWYLLEGLGGASSVQKDITLGTSSIEAATGISNQTIDGIQLQSGETLVVDRIEVYNQDFTSTSSSVSARVQDTTNATTIGSQTMGGVTTSPGSSGSGATVQVQVSNSSGSLQNLIVRVHGHIE